MIYRGPATIRAFMRSNAFVRVIVGPVGSGKSSGCIAEIVRRACKQAPSPDGKRRTKFAIIRNTFPQLRDTTRKTFEQWIDRPLVRWRERDFTAELRFADVECDVIFRALDSADDVGKLLSLELTGAYLNEVREIPKSVLDALEGRVGRYPSVAQGGCTWSGIWADTNPWHSSHWGAKMFKGALDGRRIYTMPSGRSVEYRLFRQPSGLDPAAENLENLPQDYYPRLLSGKDQEWIKVYVDGQDASSDQGSVYGPLIDKLEQRGGLAPFETPHDGVFTSWDLGISDATAIFFWRINGAGSVDVIDHYERNGMPLSHFLDLVESKPYRYVKHWFPHDARARTLQTGSSTVELANARFPGMVAISPSLSLADGLQAARCLLEGPIRIHPATGAGLDALRAYHYEWDEDSKCFGKTPVHDFSSHSADAFRYLACVARFSEQITRKPPLPDPDKYAIPVSNSMSLDQLFDLRDQDQKTGSRRI